VSDSTWDANKRHIIQYYQGLLNDHGPSTLVADATTIENQRIRYEVLAVMADYNGKSVLDVGCGLGWFAEYLSWKFVDVKYTGVDISPLLIEQAQKLYPHQQFMCADILEDELPQHDIVVCNGIFYLLQWTPYKYMFEIIRQGYEIAKEAVLFTSLNGHLAEGKLSMSAPDVPQNGEFWARPDLVLGFVMDLCPKVVLRADYLPQDFACSLRKI